MIALNDSERMILRTVKAWQQRYSNSPTVNELSLLHDMTVQTVEHYLQKLSEKGYLEMVYSMSNRRMIVPLFWE